MNKKPQDIMISTAGASMLIVAGLALVSYIVIENPDSLAEHSYVLPILIGLIAFPAMIFTILYASRVTHSIGASSRMHAFGMPPGSIRAVLATGFMVLVLIFGVFTITVAGPDSNLQTLHKIPLADEADTTVEMLKYIKRFPSPYLVTAKSKNSAEGTGGVVLIQREVDNQSSVQLAQQVLTMLATALTAIVGFYFGSRTANEPQYSEKLVQNSGAGLRNRLEAIVEKFNASGGSEEIKGVIIVLSADSLEKKTDRLRAFDTWFAQIALIRKKLDDLENADNERKQELAKSVEAKIIAFEAGWSNITHMLSTDSLDSFDTMIAVG